MKKAFKKIMAMGLATLLGIGTMNMMMVSATETETETTFTSVDLFTNGGFENATAKSWGSSWAGAPATSDTLVTSIEEEIVHSGKKAFKMQTIGLDATTFKRGLYGSFTQSTQANSVTEVTGWVNVTELSEDSYLEIGLYGKGVQDQYTLYRTHTIKGKTDGWVQFFTMQKQPHTKGGDTTYIRIGLYGTGTVYIDDVSVKDVNSLLPTDFGYNWLGTGYSSTAVAGTTHYVTMEENYEGAGSLYLGAATYNEKDYSYPRIYTTFGNRVTLKEGGKYRLSFRYKPKEEGNTPARVHIGKSGTDIDPYNHKYHDLRSGLNLVKGELDNGWQEYHAYFTMPALTENTTPAIMLYCIGSSMNGYYDSFYLAEDYEDALQVTDVNGKSIESIAAGEKIYLKKHIISDKTEAQGGKKVTLIAAVYEMVNGKKVLGDIKVEDKIVYDDVDVIFEEVVRSNQGADDVTLEYTVPTTAAGQSIKAFCWDGVASLSAIDGSVPISVSAPVTVEQ